MKRLWLGLFLIIAASAVLLISDWNQRVIRSARVPRVAFVQHVSQKVFDDAVQGMNEAFAEAGLTEGKSIVLEKFNAEGDAATGNTIAKQVAGGGYDLIITMSTLSLQSVANANKDGKTKHVFGLVSDPSIAGVGVSKANPLEIGRAHV